MVDRMMVMYAGTVVESGTVDDIFYDAAHAVHGRAARARSPASTAAARPAHADPRCTPRRSSACRPGARSRRAARWSRRTASRRAAPRRHRVRRAPGGVPALGRARRATTIPRVLFTSDERGLMRDHGHGRSPATACAAAAPPVLEVRDLVKHFPIRGGRAGADASSARCRPSPA